MKILKGTLLYGQSGGPTSVINASCYGVITQALNYSHIIDNIYLLHHGILGLLNEDFYDVNKQDIEDIKNLIHTPGSALGSVRYKLKDFKDDETDYKRIIEVFKKYNVRYFFYNGGNDSMDTCNKINEYCKHVGYECNIIGIPKTIDNDLPFTDHTPGFASASKFIANVIQEISYDNEAYEAGRVNIVEIMGRHAGWLTASSSLASINGYGPDLIYVPEVPFNIEKFKEDILKVYNKKKRCLVAVSEGINDGLGNFISDMGGKKDAFGHTQLGGIASYLLNIVTNELNLKGRAIELSLLQRCASHIQSKVDVEEAIRVGEAAVRFAINGITGVMVTIIRNDSEIYEVSYSYKNLSEVANVEYKLKPSMINKEGNNITDEFIKYALPLIEGINTPTYKNGLQSFTKFKK